ncbi:MAG: hypothetical protein AABN33_01095 [Acidobacteriota bacterium]
MKGNRDKTIEISEETRQEAKKLIEGAFRLFAEHAQNINDELVEFNKKREKARRRIQDGARRTSGTIV